MDRVGWVETRKEVLRRIKNQVQLLLGEDGPAFRNYARSYKESFLGVWQESQHSELLRSVRTAKFVLGGDFHAFAQAQRVHLRILRELDGPVSLALECVEAKHQNVLDKFLNNEISDAEFLKETQWESRWGFPWSHYKPLLYLAREKGFRVFGVNKHYKSHGVSSLYGRDRFVFEQLEKIKKQDPESLVYLIIGDLHLGYDHLPFLLECGIGVKPKELVLIYQNSEKLYFDLAEENRETTIEVMKSSGNRYCILGAPPWVKWQSFLMFLEQTYDRDLGEDEDIDYSDYMKSLIEFAGKDLKLVFPASDIQVIDSSSELAWNMITDGLNLFNQRVVTDLMEKDRSFFLPFGGKFYVARYSLNHMASLAGQYIHSKLSRRTRNLWSFPQDFYGLIWVECVGFFFSKLINHRRKAESLSQIKSQLNAMSENDRGKDALNLVLDQRLTEFIKINTGRERRNKFVPSSPKAYLEASRILGQMMGERLFLAFDQGRMGKETLIKYLEFPVESTSSVEKFYWSLVKRLESSSQIDLEGYHL